MKTVCLIGKPNVGKSSIFNRLIKEKKSIILSEPGITRDRIYGTVEYKNKRFSIVDTGGIHGEADNFDKDILLQAELAIDEADIILFVVDGLDNISDSDKKIRNMLKKAGKEVIVLVNKIDNEKRIDNTYAYYELGFENIMPVSAEHNLGFKELLEYITKNISEVEEYEEDILKFCFIGRPNVGKSSLINALLNEERVIVSDVAGTTRDAIDTRFTYEKNEYIAIDTAGMRKKGRIYESIEKYSLLRSMKAIERSDVCVLVIDGEQGIIEHDKHILSYAIEAGKGIVIAVNKWDTMKDPNEDIKRWKQELEVYFKFVPYINFVFVSAKTRKRIHTLMPEIIKAYENNCKEIQTSLLNDVIVDAVNLHQPPSYKGKRLKIYFVNQTESRPPKFTFQVNNKKLVHFSYERYLENKIRESFDLQGTPIILQFKNKSDK
ncbi:MAG: ribosome biogenesis GTPase Der [Firmicutes bacterium]|nr:ribosome biogenesis GTPase Der [Bacillota bacterium]